MKLNPELMIEFIDSYPSHTGIDMKIGHIEIFVKDPMKSREFYREILGFEEVAVQGGIFVWLKSGSLEVLLRPGKSPDRTLAYQLSSVGIVLYTDNLESTSARLKSRGIRFLGNDGSDKCLTFTDPDGNWFQLVDPNNH